MASDKVTALQQWCQEKTTEDLIAVVVTMTKRTKDAEQKAQELQIEVERLQVELAQVAQERSSGQDLQYQLDDANKKIGDLNERLEQATLWVQHHPREDANDTDKEVTRMANYHICLLQGLVRRRFLADAAAKCKQLTEGEDMADVEEIKTNAIKWVLWQMRNQSADFLRQFGIEGTEYNFNAKTFILRNRHCRLGVFMHCWPCDFTMFYGN
jgi:predicted nuclease with TOPRIM domain